MIKHKAFKFRIYPTNEQALYFANVFGCCRFIWNAMLSDKVKAYEETGQLLQTTPAQYKGRFAFLKCVDSYALCNEQINLQRAYATFFKSKGKAGFPRYKSKKHSKSSFTTNNVNGNIQLSQDSKFIRFCKVNHLRIKCHRQIPANHMIKGLTISKTPTNKYYCSILTEYETHEEKLIDTSKAIGLDYSSTHFYIDNNGNSAEYPKFYRLYQDRLAKEQRKLSHMVRGSKNFEKQKVRVALMHERIANCRKDWLEKLSCNLAKLHDVVCIEDLNVIGISKSLHLAKSTLDNSWGAFVSMLERKCKLVLRCGRFYPSSKTCHHCGYVNNDLTISDREWACPHCGELIARDENAAKNILDECLRKLYDMQKGGNHPDSPLTLGTLVPLSGKPCRLQS